MKECCEKCDGSGVFAGQQCNACEGFGYFEEPDSDCEPNSYDDYSTYDEEPDSDPESM